ncbi:NAD-dependent epimerase/dehydratase family protein [Aquibaculum sediminis]|uniref:NAD-dependent epimerase/dehydratase family protein n=1 Tax=Aquibaculum sediminis TaxID=3231907 RepID=UPI00345221C8
MTSVSDSAPAVIAVTGASGFVGRATVARLAARGLRPRILLRRPDPVLEAMVAGVVRGDLTDSSALERLVAGADVVVHIGGLVSAVRSADFHRINCVATERLAGAAAAAGVRRFLLVSSLAARQPELSPYAASKNAAEKALVRAAPGLRCAIVRPPGVYGPGDRATLPIFRQLAGGLVVMPGSAHARFSLIYVEDLARALVSLVEHPDAAAWDGEPLPLDDGAEGGYAWSELAALAGRALGRRVRVLQLPPALLAPLAWGSAGVSRLTGRPAMISPGKLRELAWLDWVAKAQPQRLPPDGRPRVPFTEGFTLTLQWYEKQGWLSASRALHNEAG